MKRKTKRPADAGAATFVPPYPPSWVDRLTAWIDRLPGPAWAIYALMAGLLCLATLAVQWSAGTYPVGTVRRSLVVGALITPYALGLITYLDRSAQAAMAAFRPAMRGDEGTFRYLTYVLTTIPSRQAILGSVLVLLGGLALAALASLLMPLPLTEAPAPDLPGRIAVGFRELFEVGPSPISYLLTLVVLILNWWTGGALVIHTIRRLTLVARIYQRHANVDLFRQRPLYALSQLTAQTTIGGLLLVYALASVPAYFSQPVGLVTVGLIIALGLASFAFPLIGVHRVLVQDKERRQESIADRLNLAGRELHGRIDKGNYRGMDEVNKAIDALEVEHRMVGAMPTWPWQPETFRTVMVAAFLPFTLWLIQYVLEKVLG
jgi:hypothetical protein